MASWKESLGWGRSSALRQYREEALETGLVG